MTQDIHACTHTSWMMFVPWYTYAVEGINVWERVWCVWWKRRERRRGRSEGMTERSLSPSLQGKCASALETRHTEETPPLTHLNTFETPPQGQKKKACSERLTQRSCTLTISLSAPIHVSRLKTKKIKANTITADATTNSTKLSQHEARLHNQKKHNCLFHVFSAVSCSRTHSTASETRLFKMQPQHKQTAQLPAGC